MKIFICACCTALCNMWFRPNPLATERDLEAQKMQEIESIKKELQDYSDEIQRRIDAKFNSNADLNPQKKKD